MVCPLMLHAKQRSSKFQFYSLNLIWLDPTGAQTHDPLHLRHAPLMWLVFDRVVVHIAVICCTVDCYILTFNFSLTVSL